jgi:hypothetical protein
MASVSDLKSSKFLKKEDVGEGVLVTIAQVHQMNVAMEGAPEDLKWVLSFREFEKPMVLNSTNGQIIGKFTGVEDDIELGWVGRQIVLYNDPNITFGGKLVGGIRVRAPRLPNAEPEKPKLPF